MAASPDEDDAASADCFTHAKVPKEELEALRDAVYGAREKGMRVEGYSITLAWALRRGLAIVTREIEAAANAGAPFPPREAPLRRGRPYPVKT